MPLVTKVFRKLVGDQTQFKFYVSGFIARSLLSRKMSSKWNGVRRQTLAIGTRFYQVRDDNNKNIINRQKKKWYLGMCITNGMFGLNEQLSKIKNARFLQAPLKIAIILLAGIPAKTRSITCGLFFWDIVRRNNGGRLLLWGCVDFKTNPVIMTWGKK